MKRSGMALLVCSIVVVCAGGSVAGPPLNGTYDSTDLGGLVQLGRHSESFLAPDGSMNPGATLNVQSWDGASLGLQWKYWCGTQVAPAVLLIDNVNASGNGNRTYMKTYVGGFIWLSGAGPWANGDPDYPGFIDTYTEFVTVQYVAWERVASVLNIDASAHFDNYSGSCMTFGIGNGSEIGSTDWGGTLPAGYPALLQQGTCDPVMVYGSWWDLFTITFSITACATPVEEATWGSVKSLYAD